MSRYWLKEKLHCHTKLSCGKCSKWMKCLEKFVQLSHNLVKTGEEKPIRHSPTDTKELCFVEKKRIKPDEYHASRRKDSRIECGSNKIYIMKNKKEGYKTR